MACVEGNAKTAYKVPLLKCGRVTAYALVSPESLLEVAKHRWYRDSNGYPTAPPAPGLMHRFVIHARRGEIVDHINGDILDNRLSNLRIVTSRQNHQNRKKRKGTTSLYKGVSSNRSKKKSWTCRVGKEYIGTFATELEAASAYNIVARQTYGEYAKLNNIEIPPVFALPAKPIHKENLPTGVSRSCSIRNKFKAQITHAGKQIYLGVFKTTAEAHDAFKKAKARFDKEAQAEEARIRSLGIQRNEDGIAVLHATQGVETVEILVDDDEWHELKQYSWCMNNSGYAANGTLHLMHRYIKGVTDSRVFVDHVNRNPCDNRRQNLRVTKESRTFNARNRAKSRKLYTGVTNTRSGKYRAAIGIDWKQEYLGTYDSQVVAAWAYDQKCVELHGPGAEINRVPKPKGWIFQENRAVQISSSEKTDDVTDEDDNEDDDVADDKCFVPAKKRRIEY